MDFLKKGEAMLNKSGSGSTGQQPVAGNTAGNTQAGGEDYGDKGLDFVEKKTGHNMGRDTNEKITDGARGLYEKATGTKVDPKYSN